MAKTIISFFPSGAEADRATDSLLDYGFRNDEISVISKDADEFRYEHPSGSSPSNLGTFTLGVITGAAVGFLIGFAAYYAPGLEITRISFFGLSGITGIVIAGALIGAVLGGIIGLLSGPANRFSEARPYEFSQVQLIVPCSDYEEAEVRQILEENGALKVRSIDLSDYEEAEYAAPRRQIGVAGFKGGKVRRGRDRFFREL